MLMLDNISDPGNLGTILRTADWFGIHHVVCSPETVDLFNPKTVQATMGSIARVHVYYSDLAETLKKLKPGIKVYGSMLQGKLQSPKLRLQKMELLLLATKHMEFPQACYHTFRIR
jgi:tRNA G18 (ribose-2'-O)-methylase SpoU